MKFIEINGEGVTKAASMCDDELMMQSNKNEILVVGKKDDNGKKGVERVTFGRRPVIM